MASVGSAPIGRPLISQGVGVSPTYKTIGSDSGLTAHGVIIAEGIGAFVATSPGTAGQVLTSNGAALDPSFQSVSSIAKAIVIAYLTTGLTNVTGDNTSVGPLIFDTTITNILAAYNTATGIFTAPVEGDYLVTSNVMFNNLSTNHASGNLQFFRPIGGTLQGMLFNPGLNSTANTGYVSVYSAVLTGVVHLLIGQQFEIVCSVNNGTKTVGIQGNTFANDTSLSIVQL